MSRKVGMLCVTLSTWVIRRCHRDVVFHVRGKGISTNIYVTKMVHLISISQLSFRSLFGIYRSIGRSSIWIETRRHFKTMKIDTPEFKSIFTPDLEKLSTLFKDNKFELRIAGGAVRDLLMHIPPADIDFASSATPTMMIELFERENVRMLHTNGELHGTVTCRIGENNFEITTLRVDVVCDGRRAKVEYTADWELDANRRDLTINSMFLDLDGTVVDYTGGIADVENRRVAFVGDAATRIQEDFLRILRYFRFFGRISKESFTHEEQTIKAIVENKDGLAMVSPERIWTEMKRIVIGRLAPSVVKTMLDECDLGKLLGLPKDSLSHMSRYERIYKRGKELEAKLGEGVKLESMTMIAALCTEKKDIDEFHAKTKLSNLERHLAEFIIEKRDEAEATLSAAGDSIDTQDRYWKRLLTRVMGPIHKGKVRNDADRLRSRVVQLAITVGTSDEVVAELLSCELREFEIDGVDLMNARVPPGPRMQFVKMYLFNMWIDSDMTLSKESLVERALDENVPGFETIQEKKGKKRKSPSSPH